MLWIWLGLRVSALTLERVGLRRLGDRQSPWPVMTLAYGGAALGLWAAALAGHDLRWRWAALLPSLTYWAAFTLYTVALVEGPLAVVSPWANATVPLLFALRPSGGVGVVLGLAIFAVGTWMNSAGRRLARGVWYMLASDALLAVARLQDAHQVHAPLSYGATLYTLVAVWMVTMTQVLRQPGLGAAWSLLQRRLGWGMLALSANAASYLTLLVLLRHLPPGAVEAVSGLASFFAAWLGVRWLGERQSRRTLWGALLMALGAGVVLYDHAPGFGVQ